MASRKYCFQQAMVLASNGIVGVEKFGGENWQIWFTRAKFFFIANDPCSVVSGDEKRPVDVSTAPARTAGKTRRRRVRPCASMTVVLRRLCHSLSWLSRTLCLWALALELCRSHVRHGGHSRLYTRRKLSWIGCFFMISLHLFVLQKATTSRTSSTKLSRLLISCR